MSHVIVAVCVAEFLSVKCEDVEFFGERIAEKLEVHSLRLSMDLRCIAFVKSGRMEAAVDVLQITFHSSEFLQ